MRRRSLLLSFVMVALLALPLSGVPPTTPLAAAIPRPDGCTRIVTSGGAFIGHDCKRAARVTRVDHRLPARLNRPSTRHERPIERFLSRGKGRIHATGDKGARRELREKGNHRQRNRHNRR